LDYCAGSGGKTLAFAPRMENSGQIYLYDVRKGALLQAKKRLKRAGIQNAHMISEEMLEKKYLSSMDWVLVDAPCSGSGTLRRNPDMKWHYDEGEIQHLVALQKEIFSKALRYVKVGGKIVYSTCSVFPEENEEQMVYFQKKFSIHLVKKSSSFLPQMDGMDGFFGATFEKEP
jgi:16S rRNA (cytosine967-C5)-methyltransferase